MGVSICVRMHPLSEGSLCGGVDHPYAAITTHKPMLGRARCGEHPLRRVAAAKMARGISYGGLPKIPATPSPAPTYPNRKLFKTLKHPRIHKPAVPEVNLDTFFNGFLS